MARHAGLGRSGLMFAAVFLAFGVVTDLYVRQQEVDWPVRILVTLLGTVAYLALSAYLPPHSDRGTGAGR